MAYRLLDAVGTTGASSSIFLAKPTDTHTVQVVTTTVAGAVVIDLEGSLDNRGVTDANAAWLALGSYTFTAGDLTAKQAMFHVISRVVPRIRVNLTSYTPNAGTLTAKYLDKEKC